MLRRLALLIALLSLPLAAQAGTVLPPGFSEAQVADVAAGTALAIAPDGRIFVCEKAGSLRVIKNNALLPTPFMTLTVDQNGERGLIGVALDPDFSVNNYLYCYYTATAPAVHNRVSRFTANGDVVLAGSEVVLVDLENLTATNHNGGAMHFGPDGKLYIAVGENAVMSNSQRLDNRLGKVLRYNPDGSIPTDNPFYGNTSTTAQSKSIFAWGLRNPFTFAFHRITGRLFINDVGGNGAGTTEEIEDGLAGANYGWPTTEGPFNQATYPNFTQPFHSYVSGLTSECAIVGGSFYDPPVAQFPVAYQNLYFFSDYCGDWIHTINPADGSPAAFSGFATGVGSVVDLAVDRTNGTLIYYRADGIVRRVSYTGSVAPYISQQPSDLTVTVGQPATFCVSAGGSPAPTFQWQRNGAPIGGATSACYTLSSTVLGDSGAQFRVVVTNAGGSVTSTAGVLTVTTNTQPSATILSPTTGTLYSGGQSINFWGSGTDAEDGALAAGSLSWTIVFHHDTHTHPFLGPLTGTGGSISIPTVGETATNVWYRFSLTVTDAGGLSRTVTRDIFPQLVSFTVQTAPLPLSITVDGAPVMAPQSVAAVNGMLREIGALSPQSGYSFASWSDAGAQAHYVTASAGAVYTANFLAFTRTPTPTRTSSPSPVFSPTPTRSNSPSPSFSPTPTRSPTLTASPSASATPIPTQTATRSSTPPFSATFTATVTPTATYASPTPSATVSPTAGLTPLYDAWDPADDVQGGASVLPIPALTPTLHGLHYLGYGTDTADWLAVTLTAGTAYGLGSSIFSGTGTVTVQVYDPSFNPVTSSAATSVAAVGVLAPVTGLYLIRITSSGPISHYFFISEAVFNSPTPTPPSAFTATRTVTPPALATESVSPTQTLTGTPVIIPPATGTETRTPVATATPTSTYIGCLCTLTWTHTPQPSATPTLSLSQTPTMGASATPTASPTQTSPGNSPSPTLSLTPSPTATPSLTATLTASPSRTATLTASGTLTRTLTPTSSATASLTLTATPTATPSATLTRSPTETQTPLSGSPTFSPTQTPGLAPPGSGVPDILKVSFVPQPAKGPSYKAYIQLEGYADAVECRVYSPNFVRIATVKAVGSFAPGWDQAAFDIPGLKPGIYFCRLLPELQGRQGAPSKAARLMVVR